MVAFRLESGKARLHWVAQLQELMHGQHPCLQQMSRDLAPLQWARLQAAMAEALSRALAGGDVAAVNLSKKAGALER
eukprot:3691452-Lingulodinium_polyedra.AAC.1